jgi:hypothetical protein
MLQINWITVRNDTPEIKRKRKKKYKYFIQPFVFPGMIKTKDLQHNMFLKKPNLFLVYLSRNGSSDYYQVG